MHFSRDMILTAGLSKKDTERSFEFAQLGSRNFVRVPTRKEFENLTNNPESEYRKTAQNFQITGSSFDALDGLIRSDLHRVVKPF